MIHGLRISSILVAGSELREKLDKTRRECVQQQGVGGHSSHLEANMFTGKYPLLFLHLHDSVLNLVVRPLPQIPKSVPDIFIYSTDSAMQRFVDLNFACVPDREGNAQCRNTDASSNENSETSQPQPEPEDEGSLYQSGVDVGGNWNSCSGSCYDPSDCDINNNCLCASDKGTDTLIFSLV